MAILPISGQLAHSFAHRPRPNLGSNRTPGRRRHNRGSSAATERVKGAKRRSKPLTRDRAAQQSTDGDDAASTIDAPATPPTTPSYVLQMPHLPYPLPHFDGSTVVVSAPAAGPGNWA